MSTSLSFFGLFTPSSRKSRSSRRPRRKLDLSLQCEQLEIKIAPATVLPVLDPGFALPTLQTGAFKYDPPTGPTGSPWSFTGSSGVSSNNSGFTSGNPNAPLPGTQVAFLQQYGSISQSVPVATSGPYVLTFQTANRGNFGGPQENFAVLIDGSVVGTFAPSSTSYQSYSTVAFPAIAGTTPTITFQGLDSAGGDNTAFIDQVAVASPSSSSVIGDPSFGQPVVGAGQFQYDPTTGPPATWVFTGSSGISGNKSGFTSGNPNAPQGYQVAILQQTGSFSQSVAGLAPGSYVLTFDAAQRGNLGVEKQNFEVLINGSVVGTFTPSSTSYQSYSTAAFTVPDTGTPVITFQGLDSAGGDNTAFIDSTTLTAVAAPAFPSTENGISFAVGQANTFTVTATGTPTPTLSEAGPLPSGVTFTPATGVLGGTPAAGTAGTYPLTFTAANGVPSNATLNFILTVAPAQVPAITSANSTTFTAGTAGMFMVTTTGTPTPTLTETGTLPTGVTFVDNGNGTATITTTATATAGTTLLTLTAANGVTPNFNQVFSLTVAAVAAPTVASLSPTGGPTAGSTPVTITGTGFTGATAVDFGSTAATSFTVLSTTQILADSPAGTGTVDVTVTTPAGTSATSTADQFTYSVAAPVVTSLSPTTGPSGTAVTIIGTSFTGETAVDFGSTPATGITVVNDNTITAISPAGTGIVDVTVTTPAGTSATSTADQFTYSVAAPAVTSLSPTSGPTAGDTSVTITGTGFTGATAVDFGATPVAAFTVVNNTEITADSPAAGTGTVNVTVTTPGGTSATSTADQFIYSVAAPVVTGLSPASGPTTVGIPVTITGTGFIGATAVDFGTGVASSFTEVSSTEIIAVSPAAGTGTVNVTVTTPGGTSATSTADQFTYFLT